MKTRFVRDINASLSSAVNLPASRFNAIFFESPDCKIPNADTTVSASIDFVLDGLIRQSTLLQDFYDQNDIFYGEPQFVIGATDSGGVGFKKVEIGVYMLVELPGFENAISLDSENEAYLQYRAGNIAGGTLSIYMLLSQADENYVPILKKLQDTGSGRVSFPIPDKNVAYLFIHPRAYTDKIQILKDKELQVDAYGSELLKLTKMFNRIEPTSAIRQCLVDLVPSKELNELLSDNVEVVIEHGASGTSTVWYYAIQFVEERMRKEAVKVPEKDAKIEQKIITQPVLRPLVEVEKKIEEKMAI